jgi:hypothetical protein
VLRDYKAQPCAGAKRRCGDAKKLGRRPTGVVADVLGVEIMCLHYIASLDAPYDSFNVMKAVGRLILSV